MPNGDPLVVPHASASADSAYADHGLAAAQGWLCICSKPLQITADGAVDGTYAHVLTDIVKAGLRAGRTLEDIWHGAPVDTTPYRYGLVVLAHGACNSRHALATTLALRAGDIMRDGLAYRG